MFYIRFIAIPQNMLRLKQRGYSFPFLESKGYLDGWEEPEKLSARDINFQDVTFQGIENLRNSGDQLPPEQPNEVTRAGKASLQSKLEQFYQNRKSRSLNTE